MKALSAVSSAGESAPPTLLPAQCASWSMFLDFGRLGLHTERTEGTNLRPHLPGVSVLKCLLFKEGVRERKKLLNQVPRGPPSLKKGGGLHPWQRGGREPPERCHTRAGGRGGGSCPASLQWPAAGFGAQPRSPGAAPPFPARQPPRLGRAAKGARLKASLRASGGGAWHTGVPSGQRDPLTRGRVSFPQMRILGSPLSFQNPPGLNCFLSLTWCGLLRGEN